jgi:hypothetical protein
MMEIPCFPFVRSRLSQTVVLWPEQAKTLLGYICYPNDPEARDALVLTLRSWWQEASNDGAATIPDGLGRIQHNWLRVADILHLHSDLIAGQHQVRRCGASIGKAITLAAANAKSWGTGVSNLWKVWSTYKDVAHLVAAATIVCSHARIMFRNQPFGPSGLKFNQLGPFQMTMLMPDLVFAAAIEFERVCLSVVPTACT